MQPVGILGKDNVIKFINSTGQCCFYIHNIGDSPGQSIALYKTDKDTGGDPAERFAQWADLYDGGGANSNAYKITMHNGDADPNKRKQSMMFAVFQLNAPAATMQPGQNGQPGMIVLNGQQPQQQQPAANPGYLTIAAAGDLIDRALEKQRNEHALQDIYAKLEAMSRDREEEILDEEEEEKEEEREHAIIKAKQVEMDGYKEIAKIGQSILGQVKDTIMEVTGKGKPALVQPPDLGLNKVAGPATSNKVGEWPAFGEVPTDPEQAKLFWEDQKEKINKAVQYLFKVDGHLGDDLNLLVKMHSETPKKFENLLMQLRPEAVEQA